MSNGTFELAGAELAWGLGSAAGMTNHPDIEGVAARFDALTQSGLDFVTLGSWKLGDASGGNGYEWNGTSWDYKGGDEYVDLALGAGYNAKGLPGPGTDTGMNRLSDLIDLARSRGVETGLSLSPHTSEPLSEIPEIIEVGRKALKAGVLYVEVNLSCPNIPDRPPFYQDELSVLEAYDMVEEAGPLLNHNNRPGFYFKDGPHQLGSQGVSIVGTGLNIGGWVRSNTVGNQIPTLEDGSPAVAVNGGKAGMSGPVLEGFGRTQLRSVKISQGETISVLGVSTGAEVKRRLDLGAAAVQLGSVLYWPELVECETPVEVVEQIKSEFVAAMAS